MKCEKCNLDMIEITCPGDSVRIDICIGKIKLGKSLFRNITHYPLTIREVSKYE